MIRPKIVIVAHDVGGQGGMERHLEEVITRLKHHYDVIVVAARMNLSDPGGVRFIKIPVISRPIPLKMLIFAILASIRLLFVKYNILHTTGAIIFNHAHFSTVHFCHAGFLEGAGSSRTEGNKSMFRKINTVLASKIALWMERILYRPGRTEKLIAVSNRVKEEILKHYPYAKNEVEVVPNGVDSSSFRPYSEDEKNILRKRYELPQTGTFLLFMGGDWSRKGLQYVIEAFNRLSGEYPDLYLLVVGRGDKDAYFETISPKERSKVYFVGKQKRPQEWFGISDIFISPTDYETFSLVTHEAAAAGLIILSTKVGGVEDLLVDQKAGIIIERSTESIVFALQQVLRDLDSNRCLGEVARKRVSTLTWDNTYQSISRLYTEALFGSESGGSQVEFINTENTG